MCGISATAKPPPSVVGDGEARPLHGDRPFLGDVAQQARAVRRTRSAFRRPPPRRCARNRSRRHGPGRSGRRERPAGPQGRLEIDPRPGLEGPERRPLERLRNRVEGDRVARNGDDREAHTVDRHRVPRARLRRRARCRNLEAHTGGAALVRDDLANLSNEAGEHVSPRRRASRPSRGRSPRVARARRERRSRARRAAR